MSGRKIEIAIDKSLCVRCNKCVRVCPSQIFTAAAEGIELVNTESCIGCGHCVCVCGSGALLHSLFPREKIHKIDYSLYPSAGQVMLLCKGRRSNRAFSTAPVPDDSLRMILEASHAAPTASNMQQVEFTVIKDPEMIRKISGFVVDLFGHYVKLLENPLLKQFLKLFFKKYYRYVPVYYRMKREMEQGRDMVLRGAVAVIFIHTPSGSMFGEADGNLAYQNGSLMAESLGVSQLYTGFVCTAIKMGKGKFEKMINLPPDRKIVAGMGLGMPLFRYGSYPEREPLRYVEI